ncbi:acyl carrier protein [Lentzea sp. NBRC 105346]|uniref:acyl carrier protein n=1 Tax=Lentzea sp. NBRC 105346 TaxID=3032205 RepID=UPI0024A51B84|nr:acyl carrier protein [Lentzea sp. NBRC 105346]GLZ32258.1 acyl carrier protein [Lentzea sp. NBRC 105346]
MTTLETLRDIIEEVAEVPAGGITPESHFVDDLQLDSLAVVSLFVLVKRRIGVDVPDEIADQLTTVGQAVAYLEQGVVPV